MALTKVTKELIQGSLAVEWQSAIKTSSFQSITGQGYFVNTTASAVTVTMPATASVGDIVSIVDYAGTAQTNNITITAALNINGSSNDVKINYERGAVSIIYSGTIQGWVAEFAANDGTDALVTPTPPLTVSYLVVAGGGGGGGDLGGGGGAGGYLTNYGATALTLSVGTDYLVTTGEGGRGAIAGAGRGTENSRGGNGSNSVFSNIISTGGGGGGAYGNSSNGLDGRNGGSGGGATSIASGSAGVATTSPTQGNNGGTGYGDPYGSGGGGGAGGVGQNATNGLFGGNGGIGLTNAITVATGTGPYYAGGGGGSDYGASNQPGSGGSGGGGTGGTGTSSPNSVGLSASANTGGGGGGGSYQSTTTTTGGAGGSGIVILRYPSNYALGLTTGNLIQATGSPFTVGTDLVSVFTSGTGDITFS